jgi:thioredoxin-related protein
MRDRNLAPDGTRTVMKQTVQPGGTVASGFAPIVRKLAWILACVPAALAAAPSLPLATDFSRDATAPHAEGRVLVVLYSRAGCHWCEQARAYLAPMDEETATQGLARYRQIDIDADHPLTGFDGRNTTHRAFAAQRAVRFAPTVAFYAPDGSPLGESIVGMRLPDFYGQYLADALHAAAARLRRTEH